MKHRHPGNASRSAAAVVAALAACLPLDARAAEFLIGEHVGLTGSMAAMARPVHQGITLAVKEYNRRQKVHTAKLLTIDDQNDPAKAVAAVEDLLSKGVIAFVAGYGSNIVGAASDAAVRGGAVYLTPGGASKKLAARGYDRYFTYASNTGSAAPWLGLLPALGVKKLSLLALKIEGMQAVAVDVAEGLRKQGIEVLVHDFDPGLEDFKPLLNVVKVKDKPDAILIAAFEKDNLAFMRAAQVVRPDVKIIAGAAGWSGEQLIKTQGPLMKNTIGVGVWPYPIKFGTEAGKRFAEFFRESFGTMPDHHMQLWCYDMTLLMLEAMEKAYASGHLDAPTIAKMLRNDGKPQPGIAGDITFDSVGFNTSYTLNVVQHVPGGTEVVWPTQAATAKLVLPARPW